MGKAVNPSVKPAEYETADAKFADIRPYTDAECPAVINRLLKIRAVFSAVARFAFPRLYRFFPRLVTLFCYKFLSAKLRNVRTIRDFQVRVIGWFFFRMLQNSSAGIVCNWKQPPGKDGEGCLLLSNHRDISVDPALICYAFYTQNQPICMIGIGDNLLQNEYATDVMKLNRSFIVRRSAGSPKIIYREMKILSEFIRAAIREKENVWLAQREGRAKDSRDKTEAAVVKMLMLAVEKQLSPAEALRSLNIRPVSISYQYDPCDIYKARELCQRRSENKNGIERGKIDNRTHLTEMAAGISGYKGKIRINIGKVLRPAADATLEDIIKELDRHIIGNYVLFNSHFYALKRLTEMGDVSVGTFEKAKQFFNIGKISCPYLQKRIRRKVDQEYLKDYLHIYANPVLEKMKIGEAHA